MTKEKFLGALTISKAAGFISVVSETGALCVDAQSRHPKRKELALEGGRSKQCNLPPSFTRCTCTGGNWDKENVKYKNISKLQYLKKW